MGTENTENNTMSPGLDKRKVLFCGLNKTGTTSLHQAFVSAGLTAYHGKDWIRWFNETKLPDEYDMYCDGSVERLRLNLLSASNHIIILNTRPLFNWLVSRCKHARAGYRLGRRPDFDQNQISQWLYSRKSWHKRLLKLDPFVFNIEDKDSHAKLSEHLGIDLTIPHVNKREDVTEDIIQAVTSVLSENVPKQQWNTLLV